MFSNFKFNGIKSISLLVLIAFGAIFNSSVFGAGETDTTFNAATYANQNSGATLVVAQPDGKLIIGGAFTVVNGVARHGIARLNLDGSLDTSFNPPDFYDQTNGLGQLITSIVFQSNGKMLVGGRFTIINSNYRALVRLNSDGTIDNTFQNYFVNAVNFTVGEIAVLPDDGLLILGQLGSFVYKLDANGFEVAGYSYFNTGGFLKDLAALPDGRFYVSDTGIERHNANGSIDPSFPTPGSNNVITEIVVQPDGKILIAGTFTSVSGFTYGRLARLNSDATVDLTFNTNGIGANGTINDIKLTPSGDIYIGGDFTQYNGMNKSRVAKLNSNGIPDAAFTYTPPLSNTSILDIDVLPNGKIAIAGISLGITTAPATVVLLNSDGSADSGFVTRIGKQSLVREVIQQTDGKVLIVGSFPLVNGIARNSLARLNNDGTLDTGFVPYFNGLTITQSINAVALQPDGKIIVGSAQGIILRRLNTDGTQDTSFTFNLQNSSTIFDIALQPDGKVIIAGNFGYVGDTGTNTRRIGRLNADGTIDGTFTVPSQPNAQIYRALPQPDGKILIAGDFTQIGSSIRGRIARLNTDGTLDNSFNPPAGANGSVYGLDLQLDGKVVIGGIFTQLHGSNAQVRLGRLNADGSLDTSFAQTANNTVNAIKIQPNGKILVGGIFSTIGATAKSSIARLNSNGTIDSSFTASITALTTVVNINLQTDGKILISGDFTEVNNISSITVARLLNAAAPLKTLFDYDGDGRADVSVFRPSTNRWYEYLSGNNSVVEQTFGLSGDLLAPADYDGDGKTDIAIFRPATGDWWYLSSINNAQVQTHWGGNGDIPRPSDFDGDGKADFIVFRPAENNWYRFGSTGAVSIVNFGLAGDKPVTGDFDGDGKSDVAIYRPSTGTWWYRSSINNAQIATQFGISSDIPSAADFDGDGKTDFAVYRPSTGVWYILNSSNGQATIQAFGLSEDKPIAADYDGDGKADIAVFRPSTGIWYLLRSTAGFTALQFGISTDIPTENAFVP